jgi:hypothetical protein
VTEKKQPTTSSDEKQTTKRKAIHTQAWQGSVAPAHLIVGHDLRLVLEPGVEKLKLKVDSPPVTHGVLARPVNDMDQRTATL